MVVYIEYVIVDNLVFDSLLLFAAAKTLKLKTPFWRVLCGGAAGTLGVFGIVYLQNFLALAAKTALLFAMCFVCFGRKRYFLGVALTAAYTFLLGGLVVGVFMITKTPFDASNVFCYQSGVPLGVYVGALWCFSFFVWLLVSFVKTERIKSCCTLTAQLTLKGKTFSVSAFLDSGNSLCLDGVAVVFATGSFAESLKQTFAAYVLKSEVRSVTFSTLAGEKTTLCLPCEVTVGEKNEKCFLALSSSKTKRADLILNSCFLEVQNAVEKTA